MTVINRGFTFTDGVFEQCSYTALAALVDNAAVTSIGLAEFSTNCRLNQISASTPGSDQGEGSLWFDTTLNLERVKTSDGWFTALLADVKNNSGSQIFKGSFVVLNGPSSVVPGATYKWAGLAGVLTATMADGTRGPYLQRTGFANVLCLAPVTIGDTLVLAGGTFTSYANGYAVSRDLLGFTSATMGLELGMARGNLAGTSTGMVTAMLFM